MTQADFLTLLRRMSDANREIARKYVTNTLPNHHMYIINSVADNRLLTNRFSLFFTGSEVVQRLCRDESLPVWIDISVKGVYRGRTVFELHCSDRYTQHESECQYASRGQGPFGLKSPALPLGYQDGQLFTLPARHWAWETVRVWLKWPFRG